MRLDQITRVVPPEALVTAELMPRPHIRVYAALRWLKPHLAATGLAWGITGSTGFELATGIATLHPESDLDLLLRTPAPVTHTWAKDLVHILDQAPCHIDVQLDTPFGGIALREWARSPAQVLIKKSSGACLVRDPWHSAEHAA
jgi:phosphoribosyl-dephospho-CoA transferase